MRKYRFNLKYFFKKGILMIALILQEAILKAQNVGYVDSSNVQTIRINPKAALTQQVDYEDVINELEYIPLETTNKSAFGTIDQLEITPDYFIILDKSSTFVNFHPKSSILIFTKEGKFHARIDLEWASVFAVDHKSHEIVAPENGGRFLSYFDFNGKLIRKVDQPFLFDSFVFLPGDLIAYFKGFRTDPYQKIISVTDQQKFCNILLCKPNFEINKVFFPFDTTGIKLDQLRQGNLHYFTTSGSEIFVRRPYQFHFFNLEKGQLIDKYHFIFPLENSLPSNFLADKKFKGKWVQHLIEAPDEIFDMSNFYKTPNAIAFTLYNSRMIKSFFYNLKTGALTSLSSIKTDSKNVITSFNREIIGSDGSFLFSWLKANQLFGGNKSSPINYYGSSNQIQEFFKNGKIRDNPILIKFKVI